MVKRIPDLSDTSKTWAEQADDFVLYYDACAANQGASWLLGLFMAQQWRGLIDAPQASVDEAKLLVRVLEAERASQGTGWSDLYFRVIKWLDEVDASGPKNR